MMSHVTDRLAAMQAVRFVAGIATAVALLAVPELSPGDWPSVPIVLAWLVLTTMAEAVRRTGGMTAARLTTGVLALDGIVIGAVISRTDGFRSPLVGLVYLHVVGVSLLISHRVALRIAVWHGFVLFGAFVLAASETSGLRLPDAGPVGTAARLAAVHAAGFLLVAVGVAACSAMNERVLRRTHQEIAALADIGTAVGPTVAADDTMAAAAATLRASLGVDAVAIAVGEDRSCRAVSVDATASTFLTADAGMARAVAALEETELVHQLDGVLVRLLPGATNVVAVPFPIDAESTGVAVVAVGGGPRRRVPESTVRAIEQAARLVGSALERARLHAQIERLAASDALTGLANRRVFESALARAVEHARRTREPLSLVVLDVDHFKAVNDGHGHHVGDEVLRHVGTSLATAARGADLPARYGGEEFVVLLPGCDHGDAVAVADKLRRAAVAGCPVDVSASAGVATFPGQAVDGPSLFAAADAALYDAKRSGRDRTVQSTASVRPRLVELAG